MIYFDSKNDMLASVCKIGSFLRDVSFLRHIIQNPNKRGEILIAWPQKKNK